MNAKKFFQWIPWFLSFGKAVDPYLLHDQDWPVDRDRFLGVMIRRRKLFDPRLRGASIDTWAMREYWRMPESIVLEAVDAFRELKTWHAEEWQIWEKLDTWLCVDGTPLPENSTIFDYLESRMKFIDPGFADLEDRVLLGHVNMCNRWLDSSKSMAGRGCPLLEWLTKRISIAEFESLKSGAKEAYADAPGVLRLSRSQRDLARINILTLSGDQLWEFSSSAESWRMLGGRAGIALVRDRKVVAHVVTTMN